MTEAGIHIRLYDRTDPKGQDHMLELLVYPLPQRVVKPLGEYLTEAANAWITANGKFDPAEEVPLGQPRPPGTSLS